MSRKTTRGLATAVAFTSLLGATVPAITATLTASSASAEASTTVTRYAAQTTNVRSGPSTSYSRVGTISAKTKVTGTLTNGWIKVTSPTRYAGRYISNSVLTSTAPATTTTPPATSGTSAWAGYKTTYYYNNAGRAIGKVPVNTKVTGKILNATYFLVTSGPYSGYRMHNEDLLWTNPAAYAPTTSGTTRATAGQTVTRYVLASNCSPAIRSSATTHSALLSRVKSGTSLTGHYVNSNWFKITSGTHAGRYITADRLFTKNSMTAYNGSMPKADMCALPAWANTSWAPTENRYVGCAAAKSLVEMNAAFRAEYGYDIKIEESYRDRLTQQRYLQIFGYPRAAMPGTSNHGLGGAIDLETRASAAQAGHSYRSGFGGPYDKWLSAHGKEYGWDRPPHLDATGSNPEPWHYDFIG